jgi:group II intron reverse transcriptase/maturase
MSILRKRIKDKTLLVLIGKYLKSGLMEKGLVKVRTEGTPQGGPLSPLLSNILLHELDAELEKRGHCFVRYADDCSIFLKSKRAAQRVLASITRFIEDKLHLEVNQEKTSICRPLNFVLLGHSFVPSYKKGVKGQYRLRIAKKSWQRLKEKIKVITKKTSPVVFSERIAQLNRLMRGWVNYFKQATGYQKLKDLDAWIRCRLRYCIWKQWKRPKRRLRAFLQLGVEPSWARRFAYSRMGGWAIACSPIMGTTVTEERLRLKGYIPFLEYYLKVKYSNSSNNKTTKLK